MALHAYGIDLSPVVSSRARKSLGIERTFEPEVYSFDQAENYLLKFCQKVAQELAAKGLVAGVIVLKLRDRNFKTITRRQKLAKPSQDPDLFYQVAKELLDKEPEFVEEGIRLLGVSAGELEAGRYQEINLFEDS